MATSEEFWKWQSWVESANDPAVGSPLQSLPYCSFTSLIHADEKPHLGIGIGNYILDLHQAQSAGLLGPLDTATQAACLAPQLNGLMRCGSTAGSTLRTLLVDLLKQDKSADSRRKIIEPLLLSKESVAFAKPVAIPNYTDFYASIHHATNVGRLFRPDQPLLPNYKWVPIGYHGRASSIVVSGGEIRRPSGQIKLRGSDAPTFAPTKQLDYEFEVAAYIGAGNPLGSPINIDHAESHIFGLTLLNDWSARDIQSWEYQPLGPFLGKSFATSVSPWVIPIGALEPFRLPLQPRAEDDPAPLPYLAHTATSFDIKLEVLFSTALMRQAALTPTNLSTSNLRDLYWSFSQLVTHHTSNGCNLEVGDLLASGTVSGPEPGSQGCLLEITQRGVAPLTLPNGEIRTFLEDGDEIILRGFCERDCFPRIALGECRGTILPATSP